MRTFRTLGFLLAIAFSSVAYGTVVFEFRGTLTTREGGTAFEIGDEIVVTYSFDPNAEQSEWDVYPILGYSIHINDTLFDSGSSGGILVPAYGEASLNAYIVYFSDMAPLEGIPHKSAFYVVDLEDDSASAFTDDSLPTSIDLNDFNRTVLGLVYSLDGVEPPDFTMAYQFTITDFAVIPEPSTFAIALAFLAAGVIVMRRWGGGRR